MAAVEASKDEDYDDDSLSSSDSEDDGRPPPMIQLEKSADLGTLKSALLTMKDKAPEKQPKEIEERLGKDVLSNIANSFEKPRDRSPKAEREKITVVDKEQYSSFKDKFEHLDKELAKQDEERRTQTQKDIEGIGAEILSKAKTMFEEKQGTNGPGAGTKPIEIERSEDSKKRVKETFLETSEKDEPRDCAVCGKMVYSVEKVQAEKRVYHKACFKCCKCQKTLSVQGYTSHEGNLYCKLHIMEIYRPEVGLAHEGALEADVVEPDDEEEYAVVAKPKMLDPSVVRSGLKSTDDLENVPKLQNAKAKWAESAEQSSKVEKRTGVEADLIQQGKVKSRLSKFVEGGDAAEGEQEDDEDDATRDPNIIRSSKKKEAVHVEVGAKTMKSKWETGTMETAQNELQDRSQELDEIKKNVSVKERFKERTGEEDDAAAAQRRSILADEQLDTTFTKTAKERFQKGEAFQDTAPVEKTKDDIHFAELGAFKKKFETGEALEEHATEKTAIDVRCGELGKIKGAFEQPQGQVEDEAAAAKRKQIEEEFNRIKNEKLAMREKEIQEGADTTDNAQAKSADDIRQSADMGSIKKRFEEGSAFQTTGEKKSGEQLEIKVAGKAREKFKQIDQDAPKEPVISQPSSKEPSKWAVEKGSAPEPINRRKLEDTGDEEPEQYEVKDILSKFKNIEQGAGKAEGESKGPKPKRKITPPPEGYRAEIESAGKERDPNVVTSAVAAEELAGIRIEAKNLKEKFEKVGQELTEEQSAEEKRKQLEEEFKRIKEMKESQKPEEPEPEAPEEESNPDLAVAAEHAQKARAKWDKIQRKEAKKAQKAATVSSKSGSKTKARCIIARTPDAVLCVVCTSKVYQMEKFECDGRFYHRPCFKCTECGLTLRLETYATAPNGCVYCRNHYKTLFNNMARPLYDGRSRD